MGLKSGDQGGRCDGKIAELDSAENRRKQQDFTGRLKW